VLNVPDGATVEVFGPAIARRRTVPYARCGSGARSPAWSRVSGYRPFWLALAGSSVLLVVIDEIR
jgi:hypothetical protein